MSKFFKGIGKGILYVIGFPFLICLIAVAAIAGIGIFLYQLVKLIFLFFTGRTLFSDLDEDIKARSILQQNAEPQPSVSSSISLYPSDSPVYGAGYSSPLTENQSTEENKQEETLDENIGGDHE